MADHDQQLDSEDLSNIEESSDSSDSESSDSDSEESSDIEEISEEQLRLVSEPTKMGGASRVQHHLV